MSLQHTHVRPLSFGLSGTVAGFWWASSAFYGLSAVAMFGAWGVWLDFEDGSETFISMVNIDSDAFALVAFSNLWMWVSGILFIVWFFQAYRSAESHGALGRRWSSGWTIGAWFIPFANLVIPKLVMNEVDRMSNPLAGEPPINKRWKPMPRLVISDLWWILIVAGLVAYWVGFLAYESEPTFSGSAVGIGYLVMALGQVLNAAGAALAGVLVLKIGKRLRRTHP